MTASSTGERSDVPNHEAAVRPGASAEVPFRHVVACVDGSELSDPVVAHATAFAAVFEAPLTILRVLESPTSDGPPDPLDWDVRRQAAQAHLDRLVATSVTHLSQPVAAECVEGRAAEQICNRVAHIEDSVTVVSRHGEHGRSPWAMSSTASKVVDAAADSLLVVSDTVPPVPGGTPRYRRILVPLDGSVLAESALAAATWIAAAHQAEVCVALVMPDAGVVHVGPPGDRDDELRQQVVRHNEEVARPYLDRVRAWLCADGLSARAFLLGPGDPRTHLVDLIGREHFDIVVLTSHGQNRPHATSCGSVAAYMLTHVSVPVLMLREGRPGMNGQPQSPARRLRRPIRAA